MPKSSARCFDKQPTEGWPEYVLRRAVAVRDIEQTEGFSAVLDIIEADAQSAYAHLKAAKSPEDAWNHLQELRVLEKTHKRLTSEVDQRINELSREHYEDLAHDHRDAGNEALKRQRAARDRYQPTN